MRKSTAFSLAGFVAVANACSMMGFGANPQSVPFTMEGGHLIVVQGAIGQIHPLNFVIDTGASSVVVSRQVAKKLQLRGVSKIVSTYGRMARVQTVGLPVVSIGGRQFKDVRAQVGTLTLAGADRRVRIDALIGLEILRRDGLSIDYQGQRVWFGPVAHARSSFPFYSKLPIITAPVSVQGRSVRLLLDTAAQYCMLYERNRQKQLMIRRTGEKLTICYMDGRAQLSAVRLSQVRMGETLWNELPAYLLDAPSPYKNLDGILGVAALGLKRLNLDFENSLVSWEK